MRETSILCTINGEATATAVMVVEHFLRVTERTPTFITSYRAALVSGLDMNNNMLGSISCNVTENH